MELLPGDIHIWSVQSAQHSDHEHSDPNTYSHHLQATSPNEYYAALEEGLWAQKHLFLQCYTLPKRCYGKNSLVTPTDSQLPAATPLIAFKPIYPALITQPKPNNCPDSPNYPDSLNYPDAPYYSASSYHPDSHHFEGDWLRDWLGNSPRISHSDPNQAPSSRSVALAEAIANHYYAPYQDNSSNKRTDSQNDINSQNNVASLTSREPQRNTAPQKNTNSQTSIHSNKSANFQKNAAISQKTQKFYKLRQSTRHKPYFKDSPLKFSISHTSNALLIAYTLDNMLGIDTETMTRILNNEATEQISALSTRIDPPNIPKSDEIYPSTSRHNPLHSQSNTPKSGKSTLLPSKHNPLRSQSDTLNQPDALKSEKLTQSTLHHRSAHRKYNNLTPERLIKIARRFFPAAEAESLFDLLNPPEIHAAPPHSLNLPKNLPSNLPHNLPKNLPRNLPQSEESSSIQRNLATFTQAFLHLWTTKEAYAKALDIPLFQAMKHSQATISQQATIIPIALPASATLHPPSATASSPSSSTSSASSLSSHSEKLGAEEVIAEGTLTEKPIAEKSTEEKPAEEKPIAEMLLKTPFMTTIVIRKAP